MNGEDGTSNIQHRTPNIEAGQWRHELWSKSSGQWALLNVVCDNIGPEETRLAWGFHVSRQRELSNVAVVKVLEAIVLVSRPVDFHVERSCGQAKQ